MVAEDFLLTLLNTSTLVGAPQNYLEKIVIPLCVKKKQQYILYAIAG